MCLPARGLDPHPAGPVVDVERGIGPTRATDRTREPVGRYPAKTEITPVLKPSCGVGHEFPQGCPYLPGTDRLVVVSGPVLVVDDDMVSRHVLGQALAKANLDHVAVGSGAEALAQIEKIHPAIVLLDLVMPQPDGYQILRILRARAETRDLPVVVLTALDAEDEIARAFEAGADDFVRKPFKPVELVARVRGQLRLRAAMDQLGKKEKDAQVVLELTQALASNLDFRGILFTVVQRLAEVVKVDRVSIVLVREQENVGYVVAASDDEHLRDLPIDLAKYPEIKQVLANGQAFVIEDAATHPLMEIVRTSKKGPTFTSLCILPILYESKPMGVLFLRSKRPGAFGERELALCQTIASAMAIALRNARVLQSLRDQTQQVTVARFEAERRMRSLQRYADFFESSADGIVVLDAEGRLLFSNPKAREITGYDETDLRGRYLGDIFADEEKPRATDLRAAFLQGKFPKDIDVRIKTRSGNYLIINVSTASVLREEGAILASFRDVTQQRAVEAELLKTKDFLQRVIDSSFDAIISADMKGRVILFNRAAERIYGRSSTDVVGSDVRSLYPDGTAREIMQRIRAGGGRIEDLKIDIIDVNGAEVPVTTLKGRILLTIPAGTQSGRTFRLTGQGMPKMKDGGAGDLYLKARVVLPPKLDETQLEAARAFLDAVDQPDPRATTT